jgi:hypothetical protein
MNKTLAKGPLEDNVDGFLESFFKREMPAPWPDARVPRPTHALANRRFLFRSHSRLAMAAAVALILFGYLSLAALFPVEPEPGLKIDRFQTIGSKPGVKQRVVTPRGGEALLWEETIPGVRPTFIINVQEIKRPQKR